MKRHASIVGCRDSTCNTHNSTDFSWRNYTTSVRAVNSSSGEETEEYPDDNKVTLYVIGTVVIIGILAFILFIIYKRQCAHRINNR